MKRILGVATAICSFLALLSCQSESTSVASGADQVLTGGRIYTVDPNLSWAEAVAIQGGQFVYVGDDEGAASFIGDNTETIDLAGRLVIPGIVDAHTHPGNIGLVEWDAFFEATERNAFMQEMADWAAANPGEGWVRACCFPIIEFADADIGPDRRDLDEIFGDRAVWINSNAGHSFWLNTGALKELGIDEDSEDPRFPVAMYKRDANGRLTGWVKEGAGWEVYDDVFETDVEFHQQSMRGMLQYLSERGVTALYDAGNKDYADDVFSFLSDLEKKGELPLRYEASWAIITPERRDRAIAEITRLREKFGGERLQFNTIKLFMDGIHENRSGAMLEPYTDVPDYVSETMLTAEQLRDFLIELHEARLNLHIHVIGDLATKVALDGVEMAREAVGEDFFPRVSLGHLQTVHESDWPRFNQLDVSANFTLWWMGVDDPDPAEAALGPDRASDTYRARALLDAGANVTFSSDDWTLEVLSPYLGMQAGHTRQYPLESLEPHQDPEAFRGPESERLPIDLLLKGYTINGAYQLRLEDKAGSIEVGKSADLVVLDDDLFTVDPYTLHQIIPAAVLLEGEVVQGQLD